MYTLLRDYMCLKFKYDLVPRLEICRISKSSAIVVSRTRKNALCIPGVYVLSSIKIPEFDCSCIVVVRSSKQ